MLLSAAMIGAGVGLGLGAAYMAGGMARAAVDHGRSVRIALAVENFSDESLRAQAATLPPGALRLAEAHAPQAEPVRPQAQLDLAGAELKAARDLDCLTEAVYFEARGETPRGQAAIAQVVMNRVRHPAFPKTVCAVVYQGSARQGCQFSFACDGAAERVHETTAWRRARKIAARALSGFVLADVGAATHFHATRVSPSWGPSMRQVAQVGLHVFYRLSPSRAAATPVEPVLRQPQFRLAAAVAAHAPEAIAAPVPASAPAAPAPVQPEPPKPVEAAAGAALTRTSDATPKAMDAAIS